MARALSGRSSPGPTARFARDNSSTSLRRCKPCHGVAAINLKVALLPSRLRHALDKGPPATIHLESAKRMREPHWLLHRFLAGTLRLDRNIAGIWIGFFLQLPVFGRRCQVDRKSTRLNSRHVS